MTDADTYSDLNERIDRWQESVIDLTRRNNLVDFTQTKSKSLPLETTDPIAVTESLRTHSQVGLRKQTVPDMDIAVSSPSAHPAGSDEALVVDRVPADATTSLKEIRRYDRRYRRERGVETLFLALGRLRWTPPGSGQDDPDRYESPLFLHPVELTRRPATPPGWHDYLLEWPGDTTQIRLNPALNKKLALECDRTLPVDSPGSAEQLASAFDEIAAMAAATAGWEVTDDVALCIFDYTTVALYEDIERNRSAIAADPLVRAIAGATDETESLVSERQTAPSDGHRTPGGDSDHQFQVLEADPSQRAAIDTAVAGESFVLQGPPGTGKSQTIANIIAEKLGHGERILFVSEKQAALDVVKERLESVDLGRFCLEVHGNHATESSVLNALETEHRTESVPWPDAFDRVRAERADRQETLDAYIDILTTPPDGFEVTPAEAFGIVARTSTLPAIDAELTAPLAANQATINRILDGLEELATYEDPIRNVDTHPWRQTTIDAWRVDTRDRMAESINAQLGVIERLQEFADRLERQCGLILTSPGDLNQVRDALEDLAFAPDTPLPAALLDPEVHGPEGSLRRLAETHLDIQQLEAAIEERYEHSLYDETGRTLHTTLVEYGLLRYVQPSYYRLKRRLYSHTRPNYEPDYQQLLNDLKRLRTLQQLRETAAAIDVESSVLEAVDAVPGTDPDWNRILGILDWVAAFTSHKPVEPTRVAQAGVDSTAFERIESLYETADHLASAFEDAADFFEQNMATDRITIDGTPLATVDLAIRKQYLEDLQANLDRLQAWVQFDERRRVLESTRAGTYLERFLAGEYDPCQLAAGFRRAFYRAWLNALYETTPLSSFNPEEFERHQTAYQRLDQACLDHASSAVQHAVTNARPAAEQTAPRSATTPESEAPPEQPGVDDWIALKRELQKRQDQRPLRELFARAETAIQELKPCFMMSPQAVAEHLEYGTIEFDTVVFDEASQIPPARAVSSLIRADQVIVAGDSKQLPPTRFFEPDATADNGGERRSLESILDEATAVLPERRLRWHYRSQATQLIAFSNEQYYDGRLRTFPESAPTPNTGVAYEYVEHGIYDRGGSRTNQREGLR